MAASVINVVNSNLGGTSWTVTLPKNETGDLIAVLVAVRNTGSTLSVTGGTGLSTAQTNDSWISRWFVKKADTGGDTSLTVGSTAAGTSSTTVYIIRGADVSGTAANAIDGIATVSGSIGRTCASPALTPTTPNCLILDSVVWDGSYAIAEIDNLNVMCTTPQSSSGVRFQAAASGIPTFTWTADNAANSGRSWVLAVKSAGGTDGSIRAVEGRSYIQKLGGFVTLTTSAPNSITGFTALGINPHTAASTTISAGQPTTLPWAYLGLSLSANESLGGTDAWCGAVVACDPIDVSGKPVQIPFGIGGTFSSTHVGANGLIIVLADASDNYLAYSLLEQKDWSAQLSGVVTILPGTSTPIASSASLPASITKKGFFYHRKGAANAAIQIFLSSPIVQNAYSAIIGGNSATPITSEHIALQLSGGNLIPRQPPYPHFVGFSALQGSGQLLHKVGFQLGDGANKTYVKLSSQNVDTPSVNDSQWRSMAGAAGVTLKTSASDTIDLRSTTITSLTLQPFTVDAASSLSAELLTTGFSLIGHTFSDLAGFAWTSASWSKCGTVAFKNGNLTTCSLSEPDDSISGTTGAVCSFSADGATVSGTSLSCVKADGVSVTGYHLALETTVTAVNLANTTFAGIPATNKVYVKYPETTVAAGAFVVGRYYKIKTPGTTNFTLIGAANNNIGTEFTATGIGSGTGDAYAGVIITTSGTTSLVDADITRAAANTPVKIAAPVEYQSFTATGYVTGSRIQVYDTTHSIELYNGVPAAAPQTLWTDTVAASISGARALRIRVSYVSGATAKEFIENNAGTAAASGAGIAVSFPVNQVADTTYNTNAVDGSTVTGITFTDAATDLVNINIASGTTTWKRIYAAFVYWISTATGIADDIAYVDGVDPANYLLTSMKIKNTSSPSVPLTITGGFGRDATSGTIADIIDTTGGNIYPLVDHVVSSVVSVGGSNIITGDIATVLAAIPSAAANASATLTAAQTTPIHANIKQVNSLTVNGAGTEADPWGPN
jgi:hypothetical protein